MPRLALCVAVATLLAVGAFPSASSARLADPGASATCSAETKRLNAFKRGMKAGKRRFFKTHRSTTARRRFVRRQQRRLAKLRKARQRCLAGPPVGGGPSPAPAPSPGPSPAPAPGPSPLSPPLARDAIVDVSSDAAVVALDEVAPEGGVEYVLTQLELELEDDATADEMTALLNRLNAQVVSSLDGVGLLTVRIPRPQSLDELRALVAGLAGAPGLVHADVLTLPVVSELPDSVPASSVSPVRPQLASFASGAWNARGALSAATAPGLLLADYFGAGPPGGEVAATVTPADFVTGDPHLHGYTVLGMAAATFEPVATASPQADQATGTWPGPALPLRVIDLRRRLAGSTLEDRIIQAIQAMPGNVVLNTSIADGCAPTGCSVSGIERDARQWITRVRLSGLEDRFLHVSAAGNIYPSLPNDTAATLGSKFNAAARRPLPGGVTNLRNTIVVENTTSSSATDVPILPVCLTATSKVGGHISAVGNDIHSLGSPGTARLLANGGTSNAAPQVAGAAAMLWGLDPAATPEALIARLTHTARDIDVDSTADPRCGTGTPAPGLDFYAAVLATDNAARAPARQAVLDADADGDFDHIDIGTFRDAFLASIPDGVDLDYGRHDLNGDGYTGGGRARMDLDAVAPVDWTFSNTRSVLGLEIGHDEEDVRDIDVLCHEAHGPRYQGDTAIRDQFAAQHCLPPVDIQADPAFPSALDVNASSTLRIRARRTDLAGSPPLAGVVLDYTVTGGTLSTTGGVTGQDGSFSNTVTRTDPNADVVVTITARAGNGGPQLDTLTVRAGNAVSVILDRRFTRSNGQCSPQASGNGGAEVSDSVDDPKRIDAIATGTVPSNSSAATSVSGSGGSAGCSGSGTISTTLTLGAGSLVLDFDGSASASSNASRTGADGAAAANAVGNSDTFVWFRIQGDSLPYSASGTFTNSLGGTGGRAFGGRARLSRRNPNGSLAHFLNYDRSGDHHTPSPVPTTLSQSGTLPAGTYELAVDVHCAASASEDSFHSLTTASCTQDGDFQITIGTP